MIQQEIDALQSEADDLARSFKASFARSKQAYDDGDHDLAKEFAEEGRRLKAECEAANARANELRRRIGLVPAQASPRPASADDWGAFKPPSKDVTRDVTLAIDLAEWPTRLSRLRDDLKRLLPERFPAEDLVGIASIAFVDRPDPRGATTFRAGSCSVDGRITLYAPPPGVSSTEEQAAILRAIGHEIGHVAWRRASEQIRGAWPSIVLRHVGYCERVFSRYEHLSPERRRREVFAEAYRDCAFGDAEFMDDYEELFVFMRDRVVHPERG